MVLSPPIQVATLGMGDSLLLMVIALVVLGPRRLPQVGRQIGKLMYEFRKASNDFKFQMEEELRNAEEADRRKREDAERQRALAEAQQAVTQAQSAAEQAINAAAQAQSAAAEISQASDAKAEAPLPAVSQASDSLGSAAEAAAWPFEIETSSDAGAKGGLRVQPPSTGEPVPAARRGHSIPQPPPAAAEPVTGAAESDAAAAEPVADAAEPVASAAGDSDADAFPEQIPVKKDVADEDAETATEPTAHHG